MPRAGRGQTYPPLRFPSAQEAARLLERRLWRSAWEEARLRPLSRHTFLSRFCAPGTVLGAGRAPLKGERGSCPHRV